MSRDGSQGALLYVADFDDWTVSIYDYPSDALVGKLMGQEDVAGECTDRAGNVYTVLPGARETVEYAHDGTGPIATFKVPGEYWAVSCAIDPTTGDLAVADLESGGGRFLGGHGDVSLYRHGQREPTSLQAPNIYSYGFVGYDNKGNLFVDGSSTSIKENGKFEYAELPRGQNQMTPITLKGGSIKSAGDIQWDGKYIAIGDPGSAVIYQTTGANIVGSTPLRGSSRVVGFFIDGQTVICADSGNRTVEFYKYPAGGSPTGSITGFDLPVAAVVSK
jgi:hypothetical protein